MWAKAWQSWQSASAVSSDLNAFKIDSNIQKWSAWKPRIGLQLKNRRWIRMRATTAYFLCTVCFNRSDTDFSKNWDNYLAVNVLFSKQHIQYMAFYATQLTWILRQYVCREMFGKICWIIMFMIHNIRYAGICKTGDAIHRWLTTNSIFFFYLVEQWKT